MFYFSDSKNYTIAHFTFTMAPIKANWSTGSNLDAMHSGSLAFPVSGQLSSL